MTVIDAMQKAGSSKPVDYLPALKSGTVAGVTGPISFEQNGSLKNASSTT
jgi:branched-chain amino acid transport system substrate-binding protein